MKSNKEFSWQMSPLSWKLLVLLLNSLKYSAISEGERFALEPVLVIDILQAQKEYNNKQQGSWNGLCPVTRTVPNRKAYDRNRIKHEDRRIGGGAD